jgi:hypothetical protein
MLRLLGCELACIGRRFQAELGLAPLPAEIVDCLERLREAEAASKVLRGAQSMRVTGYIAPT